MLPMKKSKEQDIMTAKDYLDLTGQKPPRKKPDHPESRLQAACVRWFDAESEYRFMDYLLYAIPNGGKRSGQEALAMQKEGVKSGVPDLHLAVMRGGFGGLYIEMKVGKNTPTANQVDVIDRLVLAGYCVRVCYTFESFQSVIQAYLSLPIV
jgi:hypothetical protein